MAKKRQKQREIPPPSRLDEAEAWLREGLRDGWRDAAEVIAEAKAAGVTIATLRRAADHLEIRKRKLGLRGAWQWGPPKAREAAKPPKPAPPAITPPPPAPIDAPTPARATAADPGDPDPEEYGGVLPPAALSDQARRKWCTIVGELQPRKSWSDRDRHALYILVTSLCQYERAEIRMAIEGDVVEGDDGRLQRNPHGTIQNQAWDRCCKLLAAFGLTPAGRVAIKETDKKKASISELMGAE